MGGSDDDKITLVKTTDINVHIRIGARTWLKLMAITEVFFKKSPLFTEYILIYFEFYAIIYK